MQIQLAMDGKCSYRRMHSPTSLLLLPPTLACSKRGRILAAQSSAAARELQATSDARQPHVIGRVSASSMSAETLLQVASLPEPQAALRVDVRSEVNGKSCDACCSLHSVASCQW